MVLPWEQQSQSQLTAAADLVQTSPDNFKTQAELKFHNCVPRNYRNLNAAVVLGQEWNCTFILPWLH
jgi:hypothetical protein